MNRNKTCPQCKTEYLPHIEKCGDCGAVLLFPEQYRMAEEERKRLKEESVEDTVTVREGDLNWLKELREVLIDSAIPCTIHSDDGCKRGCCGNTCRLVVSSADLERARERIEEYFMEINPELRASNELLREGKCPACGSPVGPGARECPDCGLPLVIIEEEEQ